MALFLFVVLIAVVLGIIGTVASGLLYLLIIGIVLFAADVALGGLWWHRRRRPIR